METKELNGYTIDFYSEEEWYNPITYNGNTYTGLVSDISEELAERIVDFLPYETDFIYKHYKTNNYDRLSSEDSFKTLSNLPYCVITKIN